MKGIIFNLFESFIIENFGEAQYDKILENSILETSDPFVGPGSYPDKDFLTIVASSVSLLNSTDKNILKSFGKMMFSEVIKKYPIFSKDLVHPKAFLKTVDSIVHVEVKKFYAGAETPKFIYHDPEETRLIIEYHSKRTLCYLMEGLLNGVSRHFDIDLKYFQNKCTHKGDSICEFDITFLGGPSDE